MSKKITSFQPLMIWISFLLAGEQTKERKKYQKDHIVSNYSDMELVFYWRKNKQKKKIDLSYKQTLDKIKRFSNAEILDILLECLKSKVWNCS